MKPFSHFAARWTVHLPVMVSIFICHLVAAQDRAPIEAHDRDPVNIISLPVWIDASRGNGAPVTIVEYSDFQCPYCKRAARVVKQVRDAFGGRVKIVFKQMPLSFHPHSFTAAQASVCASQQGKFWEFHDRLFASNDLSLVALKRAAADVGLKDDEFQACLGSAASRGAVEHDIEDGRRSGVTGTPTFIINGRTVVGALSFDAFKRSIETEPVTLPASLATTMTGEQAAAIAEVVRPLPPLRSTMHSVMAPMKLVAGAARWQQATAAATTAGASLSPGGLSFGYQLVGTTSPPLAETVTNSGTAPLVITDISISGRDRRDFLPSYGFSLPVTVAPGGIIVINLSFAPALPWRAGMRNARLEIAEKKDSQHVALTGIGATCGGPLPACSSGCADADADGLNDAWEIAGGIDFDNDGVIGATSDLLLPGADPNRPNIYVKYDYFVEAGSGTFCAANADCAAGEMCDTGSAACVKHTHAPSAAALDTVRTAFGNHGIEPYRDCRRAVNVSQATAACS